MDSGVKTKSTVAAIFVSGLICTGLIAVIANTYTPVVEAHTPQFKRGDCFETTMEKESWERLSTPDGIIERVGNKNYLVIEREAAEKRGGDKYASSMPIAAFDQLHVKTECPKEWLTHGHK